jgi:hypothetical protein
MANNHAKQTDEEIAEIERQVDEEMSWPCVCGHFRNVHLELESVCLYCQRENRNLSSIVHPFKLDNFAYVKQIYTERKRSQYDKYQRAKRKRNKS